MITSVSIETVERAVHQLSLLRWRIAELQLPKGYSFSVISGQTIYSVHSRDKMDTYRFAFSILRDSDHHGVTRIFSLPDDDLDIAKLVGEAVGTLRSLETLKGESHK